DLSVVRVGGIIEREQGPYRRVDRYGTTDQSTTIGGSRPIVCAIWIALGDGARPIGHACDGNSLGDYRVPPYLLKIFINSPEKRLVFLDRTSESAAKVIPLIWRASLAGGCSGRVALQALPVRIIKEVPGVQDAVPQVFEHIAVKLIASALADNCHLAAHVHAIFGAESVRDDLVFADAVQPQRCAHGRSAVVAENVLRGRSVQQEIV